MIAAHIKQNKSVLNKTTQHKTTQNRREKTEQNRTKQNKTIDNQSNKMEMMMIYQMMESTLLATNVKYSSNEYHRVVKLLKEREKTFRDKLSIIQEEDDNEDREVIVEVKERVNTLTTREEDPLYYDSQLKTMIDLIDSQ